MKQPILIVGKSGDCGRHGGYQFLHRQRYADNPRRRRNNKLRRGFQHRAQSGTALLGHRDSRRSGGAIGVACIDQHCAYVAFALAQMSAAHLDFGRVERQGEGWLWIDHG